MTERTLKVVAWTAAIAISLAVWALVAALVLGAGLLIFEVARVLA